MRAALRIFLPVVPGLLVLAFALTIIGSSANSDGLLAAGIAAWLAGCVLLFAGLVLFMWTGRKKYRK